jgi:hypothetical protein
MTGGKKIIVAGIIAGALSAIWTSNFIPSTSAQESHQHTHAPVSDKQLKNPLTATDKT